MSKWVPWEQLASPLAMWADSQESVRQVRDRLRALGGSEQYNAPILIRLPDERIAPTSTPMLRKLAQEKGASILEQRLADLLDALCPEPWSVESREPDHPEALQAAKDRKMPVLVTEGGSPAGLMEPPTSHVIQPDYAKDRFDLFDEPLTPSALDQLEILPVTLDTPMVDIALELRAKKNPKNTYLLVQMEDGSYGVVRAGDLDQPVKTSGEVAWRQPLRVFVPSPPKAILREWVELGEKQAQQIAGDRRFLILTHNGNPVGLLRSGIVFRGGDRPFLPGAYDASADINYGITDAPAEYLAGFTAAEGTEATQRFVNLWFEDADQRPVDRQQALVVGRTHHLALQIGRLLERSIIDWGERPSGPQAIVEPQEQEVYLYASVLSQDFEITEPTQALWLPKEGDTEVLRIQLVPLRRSQPGAPARLEVGLYYRTYLVQTFDVEVEVGESARSSRPQVARLTHARTERFPEMEELPSRALSLTITRDGAQRYRFTMLLDPDPEDKEAAESAVKMACHVHLSRDDLTHLITKARRQLYNVVQVYPLIQEKDRQAYVRSIQALAQVGRQLHRKLFKTPDARLVADWLKKYLAPGSTIQIVDQTGDFVYPWSLLYEASPWQEEEPAVEHFWGWRYRLAISTTTMMDTYRQAGDTIQWPAPQHLQIMVGLYARLKGAQEQHTYFRRLGSLPTARLKQSIVDSRSSAVEALKQGDQHLIYFFCHGYTEKMAADIQLDDDLVRRFTELAADEIQQRDRAVREHLEDLFDVSDSWLRLTRGKLALTMLEEEMEGKTLSRHPLVFLNMCQSAQVLPSLSGGLIPFFIDKGARAVVGTECSMNMVFGDRFARAFLDRFLQGHPAGEILWQLRQEFLAESDPLALAYTLFGDADLRLAGPIPEVVAQGGGSNQ